jgi:hypothetical protein
MTDQSPIRSRARNSPPDRHLASAWAPPARSDMGVRDAARGTRSASRQKRLTGAGAGVMLCVLGLVLGAACSSSKKAATETPIGSTSAVASAPTMSSSTADASSAAVASSAAASRAAASRAAASRAAASRAAASSRAAAASSAAASRAAASRAAASRAAASRAAASSSAAAPAPGPTAQDCTPGYSPCIPLGPDVDCAGGSGNGPRYVQGPVRVTGSDPYGLDRDHDGIGCDS